MKHECHCEEHIYIRFERAGFQAQRRYWEWAQRQNGIDMKINCVVAFFSGMGVTAILLDIAHYVISK